MKLDLQRFCASQYDERAFMKAPGRSGGFVYASNGFVAVRVPEAEEHAGFEQDGKLAQKIPGLFKALDEAEPLAWQPLPAVGKLERCDRCGGSARLRVEDCDSCDGKGEFTHHNHEYDCKECDADGFHLVHRGGKVIACPECNGDGFKGHPHQVIAETSAGLVHGSIGHLSWLAALPGIQMCPQAPDKLIRFRFDGGHALMVPTSL